MTVTGWPCSNNNLQCRVFTLSAKLCPGFPITFGLESRTAKTHRDISSSLLFVIAIAIAHRLESAHTSSTRLIAFSAVAIAVIETASRVVVVVAVCLFVERGHTRQ